MKRIGALLLGLLLALPASAEVWQAVYGVSETFDFKLYETDGTLDVDAIDGGTAVTLYCNEGVGATATNDFVDEGSFYSITLTAAEMQCERTTVEVAATTTEVFFIQTSGNASAMTPSYAANVLTIEGSDATDTLGTAQTGDTFARLGAPAGASVSADIAAIEAQTDDIGVAGAGLTAIDLPDQTMNITGNVSGSVGSVTGNVGGNVSGTINGLTATALADLFDTDSGTTYASAVAGSAVKEIVDNAGGSGVTDARLGIIDSGTAQAATATTLQLRAAATFADDEIIGSSCIITGGTTGVGQSRVVTDYVSSTDTATVDTWTTTPTGTITYTCFGTAPGSDVTIADGSITTSTFAAGAIDAAAIATDAIGAAELAASAIGASELATDAIGAAEIAGDAIGASELAADAITASELAADAITSSELAATAVSEMQSGLSTLDAAGVRTAVGLASADLDTQLTTIDDFVDTEVAAILTDTAEIGAAGAGLTAVGGLGSTAQANIRTAVGLATADLDTQLAALPTAAEVATEMLGQQRILTGTCDSGSTTTCVDDALTQAAESQIDDRLICFDDSWCGLVTAFDTVTDTVTTTKTAPTTRAAKAYTIFPATAQ